MAASRWQPQPPNLLLQFQPHGETHSLSPPIPTSKFSGKEHCLAWVSSYPRYSLCHQGLGNVHNSAIGEGPVKGSLWATNTFQNTSTMQGQYYRSIIIPESENTKRREQQTKQLSLGKLNVRCLQLFSGHSANSQALCIWKDSINTIDAIIKY